MCVCDVDKYITWWLIASVVFDHTVDSDSFNYTNQGNSPTVDGIDDVQDFSSTCSALTLMGNSLFT